MTSYPRKGFSFRAIVRFVTCGLRRHRWKLLPDTPPTGGKQARCLRCGAFREWDGFVFPPVA